MTEDDLDMILAFAFLSNLRFGCVFSWDNYLYNESIARQLAIAMLGAYKQASPV